MKHLCDSCGIQIPNNVMLWEFSINEEIQCETTEENRTLYETNSEIIIYTPYSEILKQFCEDCAKSLDLHNILVPDKPNFIKTPNILDDTPTGNRKQTGYKCQECGEVVLCDEPYWSILLFKGYYKYNAIKFIKNCVIHVYCRKCAEIKDFNRMDVQRMN